MLGANIGTRRLRVAAFVVAAALGALPGEAAAATNKIYLVAGTGHSGFSGDGGLATSAELSSPTGVTATSDGGFLIADQANNRIRRVGSDGKISTVAGVGTPGFSGDGGPATAAQLNAPTAVAVAPDGSLLIADANNNRVRRVAPDGTISTVAGTGVPGFSGDGGQATNAKLAFPADIAVASDGSFYIADNDNNRIRGVSPAGIITTYAGTGTAGFSGDGGLATAAELNDPAGVALTADGGLLIADTLNNRVRRVAPDGTITTAAGTGTGGFAGDGSAATAAELNQPTHVAVTPGGGFLIADRLNQRVRAVGAGGNIFTVAGTGIAGGGGDGGFATAAPLNNPLGVALDAGGDYLVADTGNHTIRRVDDGDPPPAQPPAPPPPTPPAPLVARLTVSPNPTCTAVPTRLDGSASSGPAPIASYHFSFVQFERRYAQDTGSLYEEDVSDGPNPIATNVFTWNTFSNARGHSWADQFPYRTDIEMDLTVTDVNGLTASTSEDITFAQHSSEDPRRGCPLEFVKTPNPPLTVAPEVFRQVTMTPTSWTVKMPCKATFDCVGTVSAYATFARARLASATAKRPKRTLLFAGPVIVPAGQGGVARGKLTAAGRRLLKRHRSVRAVVTFRLFSPTGKPVSTTRTVKLELPARHH